jgi:hypothetical protein
LTLPGRHFFQERLQRFLPVAVHRRSHGQPLDRRLRFAQCGDAVGKAAHRLRVPQRSGPKDTPAPMITILTDLIFISSPFRQYGSISQLT